MVLRNPAKDRTAPLPKPGEVFTLIKRREYQKAHDCLLQILGIYPSQPQANYLMALNFSEAGQKKDALPYAERAYAGDPKVTEHIFLLGRLYVDISLYEHAYPLLKTALMKSPKSFLILWAMANYFHEIQKGEKARDFYEKAAKEAPDRERREAIEMELTSCLTDIAEWDVAEKLLFKLSHSPPYKEITLLARGFLKASAPESDLARDIRNYLESGRAPLLHRIDCFLALGRFEESAMNYDSAFAYWTKARALVGVKNHSPLNLLASNQQKSAFFTPQLFAETMPFANQDGRLVFIAGMPRSGTTLTEQVLAAHQDCVGVGETYRMTSLANDFKRNYLGPEKIPDLIANAKRGELQERGAENVKFFEAITDGGWQRAVEKTPGNYEALGYIHLVHPKARFIHLRRHPADSFISSFQNRMNQKNDYAYDQVSYLEKFLAKERLMAHWKSCFPENILEFKYEDLVQNPETYVRKLLAFVDLPWDDSCMRFFEKRTTVRTFSRDQVRKSFYTSSVDRWKNYEKHLGPMFEAMSAANFVY